MASIVFSVIITLKYKQYLKQIKDKIIFLCIELTNIICKLLKMNQ